MEQFPFIVTVDGAAAAGKTSTSLGVAKRFGLMHCDTGRHYRTVTLLCLQNGIPPGEPQRAAASLGGAKVETEIQDHSALLRLDGLLPAEGELRGPEVNRLVSPFSALPEVRRFLLGYQRSLAGTAAEKGFRGLIMEGRDIGSVIFPGAPYKFFLEADPAIRAGRRSREGYQDAIAERDRTDSGRKNAPLTCPEGAARVDTSRLSLKAVIREVCGIIERGESKTG